MYIICYNKEKMEDIMSANTTSVSLSQKKEKEPTIVLLLAS